MPDTNPPQGRNPEEQQMRDTRFAQAALKQGLVTEAQVEQALKAQQTILGLGMNRTLPDIMIEKGLMTPVQAEGLKRNVDGEGESKVIAGFELIEKLGEGGMGMVYKAKQLSLERTVALKILPERLSKDQEFVQRFQREAKVAARLDHVNIVRALDVGTAGNIHYFAMEFVEGEDVGSILDRQGKMSEDEALNIMVQAARALEHAWEHNLIHRDIKPDNILVTKNRVAKLADLGLARATDESVTRMTIAGTAMGTPHYISPEQARGESDLDIRTDIYALGVTFFHMLTGHPPFQGSTAAIVITRRLTEEPPWIKDIDPNISEGSAFVIRKMMARDRDERYANPTDLLKDLELLVDGKAPELAGGAPGQGGTLIWSSDQLDAQPKAAAAAAVAAAPSPASWLATNYGGLSVAAWAGIGGGVAIIVGVIVTVAVIASMREREVNDLFGKVALLENNRKYDEAILDLEEKLPKFKGTKYEPRFVDRLAELRTKSQREKEARTALQEILDRREKQGCPAALAMATAVGDRYADTGSGEALRKELEDLQAWEAGRQDAEAEIASKEATITTLEAQAEYAAALKAVADASEYIAASKYADVFRDKTAVLATKKTELERRKFDAEAAEELAGLRRLFQTAKGVEGPGVLTEIEKVRLKAENAAAKYADSGSSDALRNLVVDIIAAKKAREGELATTEQIKKLMDQAAHAMEGKRYDVALEALDQILRLNPSDEMKSVVATMVEDARFGARLKAADEAQKAGKLAEARAELAAALEIRKDAAVSSRLYELDRRIKLNASLDEAAAFESQGRYRDAHKAFLAALSIAAEGDERARVQAAIDRVSKSLEYQATMTRARELYRDGKWNEAEEAAKSALEAKPGDRDAGDLLVKIADAKRAETEGTGAQMFQAAMASAAGFESGGQFGKAHDAYISAMSFAKSLEQKRTVQEGVDRTQRMIAFLAAMSEANDSYLAMKWDQAEAAANRALAAKPGDQFAAQLLRDIARAREAVAAGKRPPERTNPWRPTVEPETGTPAVPVASRFEVIQNSVGMRLVKVPGNVHEVGDDHGEADEKPAHAVRLAPFYISFTEVTNIQYEMCGRHKRSPYSQGDNYPVVDVSWQDAVKFCEWLSKKEGVSYRLPTEAEWEVAARGPEGHRYPWGAEDADQGGIYRANWGQGKDPVNWRLDGFAYAAPVGSYRDGASYFGCLDLAGNVWEWCLDWYDQGAYAQRVAAGLPAVNPRGPEGGRERVLRGGAWSNDIQFARSTNRHKASPKLIAPTVGFRVVREVPGE